MSLGVERPMIWLPESLDSYGLVDIADVVESDVFDGITSAPSSLEQVSFYVIPLLRGAEPLRLMARMPALEVVQAQSSGVDAIVPLLPAGVTLCNARSVHDSATAEMAVTLVLAQLRGIPDYVLDPGFWPAPDDLRPTLADATVLILGYGAIGVAVARRLSGFECEVIAVGRTERPGVEPVSALARLLPRADVVIVTVPLTSETDAMVDAAFLAQMRDGALLVNVGRGPVVRTDDLLAEVASGRLCAALDVTDPEPLAADHPMRSMANVLITPHAAGRTTVLAPRLKSLVAEQVRRYVRGESLLNIVAGDY